MTDAERFWSKVNKTGDCWEWTAARLRRENGSLSYGIICWQGRSTGAHRLSWAFANGPIPAGLWVLHKCDNQGCVRPDHLYLGTHADNTRDATVRKRWAVAERVGGHVLREVDVRAVRSLADAGFPSERIGPIFGVSGRMVRNILSGKRWKSVA